MAVAKSLDKPAVLERESHEQGENRKNFAEFVSFAKFVLRIPDFATAMTPVTVGIDSARDKANNVEEGSDKEIPLPKDRSARLKDIEREIENLTTSPLYEYRKTNKFHAVIGEGDPQAKIMFIGEAPGKQEALKGRPFVGAAGKILDGLLASIGLDRGKVYITNIVKDRPPENRDPQKEEIALYAPFLRKQIEIIQPKVIVTLGRFAMSFILEEFNSPAKGGKISELHGEPLKAKADYGPVTVIPLFHPAVVLYRSDQKEILKDDFQALRHYA